MKRILLIEDNKDILENLVEYFEIEGFTVISSNNGKRGCDLAKKLIPDLIVCDVLMYGMDGYEVLQLLLKDPETSRIPFIFSTSLSEKMDRYDCLMLGADDFIVKPYDIETLAIMVNMLIESGSARPVIEIC